MLHHVVYFPAIVGLDIELWNALEIFDFPGDWQKEVPVGGPKRPIRAGTHPPGCTGMGTNDCVVSLAERPQTASVHKANWFPKGLQKGGGQVNRLRQEWHSAPCFLFSWKPNQQGQVL